MTYNHFFINSTKMPLFIRKYMQKPGLRILSDWHDTLFQFPWQAEGRSLPLTAENKGQQGLTPSIPSDHLETPWCTAHRDYPTPSFTWVAHIWGVVEVTLSLLLSVSLAHSLMPVFSDADPVNALGWKSWFGAGHFDLYSVSYGRGLPFLFGLTL